MFDKAYPFNKLFDKDLRDKIGYLNSKTIYSFKTEKNVDYLIEVEEYDDNIYIIKFCQKKLKKHPKRFNYLTNEGIMPKIIATCMDVILRIIRKNSYASFGFLGSNTIIPGKKVESQRETKRFKIYKYVITNFIGEELFDHHQDLENSTYLIINKKNKNTEKIKDNANKMFDSIFPQLRH